ncbi:Anaphase-promoting complex subunit 7 [Irineochytrium annulatum]|nr:Anaphase-promoting complex subunit 7 [Irineochytrium annulatum]
MLRSSPTPLPTPTTAELVAECRSLHIAGLFQSCGLLASLLLSSLTQPPPLSSAPGTTPHHHDQRSLHANVVTETHVLLAQCHEARGEHKRAVVHYEKALLHSNACTAPADVRTAAGLSAAALTPGRSGKVTGAATPKRKSVAAAATTAAAAAAGLDADLRERMGSACVKAGDTRAAFTVLEQIAEKDRSPAVCKMLAGIYEDRGDKGKAAKCLHHVLLSHPAAAEVFEWLVRLGESMTSILAAVPPQHPWLRLYVESVGHMWSCSFDRALDGFLALHHQYPGTVRFMTLAAECSSKGDKTNQAMDIYDQIRLLDPYSCDSMDEYAFLLKRQNLSVLLNKLSQELMEVTKVRPEPWLAMARYCETKDDLDQAQSLAQKAIDIDPKCHAAYVCKGGIALALGEYADAVVAYRRAHSLRRDLSTFEGLMESYVGMKRLSEAIQIATDAAKLMPRDARVFTLVGTVHSHSSTGKERARVSFQKALSLDPGCMAAVMGQVSLLSNESKWEEASKLMEDYVDRNNNHVYHTRLGQIYMLMTDHEKAFEHFTIALSYDPDYEAARFELSKAERLIGGIEDEDMDDGVGL